MFCAKVKLYSKMLMIGNIVEGLLIRSKLSAIIVAVPWMVALEAGRRVMDGLKLLDFGKTNPE